MAIMPTIINQMPIIAAISLGFTNIRIPRNLGHDSVIR
jgi:hypothetical protein